MDHNDQGSRLLTGDTIPVFTFYLKAVGACAKVRIGRKPLFARIHPTYIHALQLVIIVDPMRLQETKGGKFDSYKNSVLYEEERSYPIVANRESTSKDWS